MEVHVRQFSPSLVVLLLYGNDVHNDTRFARIAERDSGGQIVAVPGAADGRLVGWARRSYLIRLVRHAQLKAEWLLAPPAGSVSDVVGGFVEETPEISDLTAGLLLELKAEVERAGARFVLAAVPSKYRLVHSSSNSGEPEFSDKVKVWAGRHRIEFLDLVPPFRGAARAGRVPFFERDIHFNVEGHGLVARALQHATAACGSRSEPTSVPALEGPGGHGPNATR